MTTNTGKPENELAGAAGQSMINLLSGGGFTYAIKNNGYSDYSVDHVCVQVNHTSDNVVDSEQEQQYNQHYNPIYS